MRGSLLGMVIEFVGLGQYGYLYNIELIVFQYEKENDLWGFIFG